MTRQENPAKMVTTQQRVYPQSQANLEIAQRNQDYRQYNVSQYPAQDQSLRKVIKKGTDFTSFT